MKIFYELNMTSTTKPSKEAQLPPLKEAVDSIPFFALFFTLTNSLILVCVCLHHMRQEGDDTQGVT